jgi:hypothetical protein
LATEAPPLPKRLERGITLLEESLGIGPEGEEDSAVARLI